MNLPRKCGKLYIKFDESNQPEYGFEVVGQQIKKFVPLTDKNFETIILPKLVEDYAFDIPSKEEVGPYKSLLYYRNREMCDYVVGSEKVCADCFKGLKKAKIVIPFENSVMFDWGSFDQDAQIELIVPDSLALKQVYRCFDTGFDYEHENWTIVADKSLAEQFSMGGFGKDDFAIWDYNEADLDYNVANFTIKTFALQESRENNESSDENED